MKYVEQNILGCFLITRSIPLDARGYFTRLVDVNEFRAHRLNADFVQISASRNYRRGTLRGFHLQTSDSAEEKFVTCVQGEVFDVCVDMRPDSPTYLQHVSAILSEENGQSFYIPKGCAHGFISLKDNTQLIYLMTEEHAPSAEQGYRWNDPALSIPWPIEPVVISPKDQGWPLIK